jgi:hypothetical protein
LNIQRHTIAMAAGATTSGRVDAAVQVAAADLVVEQRRHDQRRNTPHGTVSSMK